MVTHFIAADTAVDVTVDVALVVIDDDAVLLADVVAELDCEVVAVLLCVDEPLFDSVVVADELADVVIVDEPEVVSLLV